MAGISVQLYSVREAAAKDFRATLQELTDIGFAGVELAGLHGHKPQEVKKWLDDLGMKVSSAHGMSLAPADFEPAVELAKIFGYELTIISWAPPERFASLDAVKKLADEMETLALRVEEQGLKLGYHNHAHEMVPLEGGFALEHLYMLAPHLQGQLDMYWASDFGKNDVPAIIRRHATRIPSLHVKDGPLVQDAAMVAVGQGKMDIAACIRAADPATCKWLVVELDACDTDMMTAVRQSYEYLAGNKLGIGQK